VVASSNLVAPTIHNRDLAEEVRSLFFLCTFGCAYRYTPPVPLDEVMDCLVKFWYEYPLEIIPAKAAR